MLRKMWSGYHQDRQGGGSQAFVFISEQWRSDRNCFRKPSCLVLPLRNQWSDRARRVDMSSMDGASGKNHGKGGGCWMTVWNPETSEQLDSAKRQRDRPVCTPSQRRKSAGERFSSRLLSHRVADGSGPKWTSPHEWNSLREFEMLGCRQPGNRSGALEFAFELELRPGSNPRLG